MDQMREAEIRGFLGKARSRRGGEAAGHRAVKSTIPSMKALPEGLHFTEASAPISA
jgi:hypothetical protein